MNSLKMEAWLRIASVFLLALSACLVGFDSQTKVIFYTYTRKATFRDLNVLYVVVWIDTAAAVYNLLQLFSTYTKDLSASNYRYLAWGIYLLDQLLPLVRTRMFYGPGGPYALFAGKDASRALAKMSFEEKDLNGDLTGLGVFELEALQDWEYKFISKYVKVGTVKSTVPVTDGAAAATEPTAEAAANGDVEKLAQDAPSETASKETEETTTAVDAEKKD